MALLQVQNLETHYPTHRGIARAVDGISFEIGKGEFVGLAGESGCGKSTVAYSIMGLIPPPGKVAGGHIMFGGMDLAALDESSMSKIRWKNISIIFQQAMNALNPVVKVGDQIAESMMIHDKKITKKQSIERAEELFKLVGLDANRVRDYPFELSGGMKQRAIIAMSLACSPQLVISDEPTTALDVSIQAQIIDLLKSLKKKLDMSMLLISHDLSVVAEVCDRVAIMYAGNIMENTDVISVFNQPVHPYTKALIMAIPSMERGRSKTLFSIPGKPPDLLDPLPACKFAERCPYVHEVCTREKPTPEKHGGVCCHFADEMRTMTPEQLWGDQSE